MYFSLDIHVEHSGFEKKVKGHVMTATLNCGYFSDLMQNIGWVFPHVMLLILNDEISTHYVIKNEYNGKQKMTTKTTPIPRPLLPKKNTIGGTTNTTSNT